MKNDYHLEVEWFWRWNKMLVYFVFLLYFFGIMSTSEVAADLCNGPMNPIKKYDRQTGAPLGLLENCNSINKIEFPDQDNKKLELTYTDETLARESNLAWQVEFASFQEASLFKKLMTAPGASYKLVLGRCPERHCVIAKDNNFKIQDMATGKEYQRNEFLKKEAVACESVSQVLAICHGLRYVRDFHSVLDGSYWTKAIPGKGLDDLGDYCFRNGVYHSDDPLCQEGETEPKMPRPHGINPSETRMSIDLIQ